MNLDFRYSVYNVVLLEFRTYRLTTYLTICLERGNPPLSPQITRATEHSALGVLGALRLGELPLEEMCAGRLSFKYLMFRADGVCTNQALIKWACDESKELDNLLIYSSICSYHSIPNATKWALGDYNYGSILRVCHVCDAKQIDRFAEFAEFLLRRHKIRREPGIVDDCDLASVIYGEESKSLTAPF